LAGAGAGLITATLNLLIILSLIRSDQTPHQPFSAASLPGTLLGTAAITAIAAFIASRLGPSPAPSNPIKPINWTGRFAVVAAVATSLLLLAGGLVTGREAGLSVPDWPASFGYNMFLYPYARMTGNIYYEHTHRLYGALVGITTIALAIHLWLTDHRRWLKALAVVAVIAVIAQGIMGGLRVSLAQTGDGIEVAQLEHETAISAILRVSHGVFGQVFFGLMVLIAAFTSTVWRNTTAPLSPGSSADRSVPVLLVAMMIVQLALGAMVRHLQFDVLLHVSLAAVITVMSLMAGMRAWGMHGSTVPVLRHTGIAVSAVMGLQLALGIAALVVVNLSPSHAPTVADAVITTAHQMNGALLLAVSLLLAAFSFRFVDAAAASANPPLSAQGQPGI
jgi:cytochrome c oxidase assembly protein subunit 15